MKYEILEEGCSRTKKGCLKITDSETGKSFTVPKKFNYLKLVKNRYEGADEEYQFALCSKKGKALSDYRKYNKIDDKFKYINTKVIDKDEINFEMLHDEEFIFSIRPSKANSKIPAIFDIKGNTTIGTLSDSTSTKDEAPTSTGGQDHERKIVAHYDEEGKGYITLLDIMKQSAPDAFDRNGKFKYLDETDNIHTYVVVYCKGTNLYNPYEKITLDRNHECIQVGDALSENILSHYFVSYIGADSLCNLETLFTDKASNVKIYFEEIPKINGEPILFLHEPYSFQIFSGSRLIFENPLHEDIPVYFPDHTSDYML